MSKYTIAGGTITLDDKFYNNSVVIYTGDAVWIWHHDDEQRTYVKISIKDGVPVTAYDTKYIKKDKGSSSYSWDEGFK